MARKTIDLEALKTKVNHYLATTPQNKVTHGVIERFPEWEERRLGAASTLETALFMADAYAGYRYLDSPFEAGVTDESRREYY